MKRENQIREALALAAADPTWRVHTKTADVEVAVIGLATYDGQAMMTEIERLRGQLAFVACYITDMSIRGESATAWRAIEEEHGEREDSYAVAGAWLNTMRQPQIT